MKHYVSVKLGLTKERNNMANNFKSAFAAARKAGKKDFTWNGNRYNTELKETVRPKARGGAAGSTGPKPRPAPEAPKSVRDTRKDKSNSVGFDFDAQRRAAEEKKKKK